MQKNRVFAATLVSFLAAATAAHAADEPAAAAPAAANDGAYVLTLKDHAFSPQELALPAGQKVKLVVKNLDATPAEFESHELNREKVVTANGEVTIFVGPLDAGTYNYVDDFHRDTTKGTIVVK